MSITSSVYSTGHEQRDGRRYVREEHTDHLGVLHVFEYLWDGLADRDSIMGARAVRLAHNLAVQEYVERVSFDGWTGPLQHQTAAEFANKLRFEYRESKRERMCELAWWLIRRIAEGSFTDNQVRNAFGMTVTQYNAFKTRLQAAHDRWAALLLAEGE